MYIFIGHLIHEFEEETKDSNVLSLEHPNVSTKITTLHQFRSLIHWNPDQLPSSFDPLYKSLEWLELVESVSFFLFLFFLLSPYIHIYAEKIHLCLFEIKKNSDLIMKNVNEKKCYAILFSRE